MKRTAILASLLIGLLVSGDPAHAKCISILVRVQGDVVGQIQEGDELLLRFIYSPKRVETSSPRPVKGQTFTLVGAYSTYKRRGVFHADVCGAAPRQIQLVMRDRNGVVLDTVDLMTPDERTGETELSYGKKQLVVVHRPPASRSLVLQNPHYTHVALRRALERNGLITTVGSRDPLAGSQETPSSTVLQLALAELNKSTGP